MQLRMFAALAALSSISVLQSAAIAQSAAPAPTVNYSIAPVSPGSWSYRGLPGGSEARFVDSTGTARLVLECARATRRVKVSRTSAVPATSIFVWTSSASRSLPARFEANAMRVTAELPAFDALLDGMAFSRGRVGVTVAGLEALVVPAWPEAARTIEDCRI